MKIFIKIVGVFFALIILFCGVLAVTLAMFDPEDYKDEITELSYRQTGREMSIGGEIELSYYPVFGFTAQQIVISNPDNFNGDEYFASAEEMQAGVSVLALLKGDIEFDEIRLVKPVVNLIVTENGAVNYEFQPATEGAAEPSEETGQKVQVQNDQTLSVAAKEIEIIDATIHYTNNQSGEVYIIEPLNFTLSSFAPGRDADMDFSALVQKEGADPMEIDVRTTVQYNPQVQTLTANGFDGDIALRGRENEEENFRLNLKGNFDADLAAQKAALEDVSAQWMNSSLNAHGVVEWGEQSAFKNFKIDAARLDIDKLLEALGGGEQKQTSQGSATPLPAAFLSGFSANGDISIAELVIAGFTFKDINTHVEGQQGVLDFDPVQLAFYDGTLRATARLDARGSNTLKVRSQGKLQEMRLGDMSTAFIGKDYVTGLMDVDYTLNTTARTTDQLLSNLGGDIALSARDGEIHYWQLSERINQAIVYFETGQVGDLGEDQLKYTNVNASFTGQNGVFRNSDLVLVGPEMHALGEGMINLAQSRVDYTLRVGAGDEAEQFAQADHLPVTISGPLTSPRYGLNVQALIADQAGDLIEEKKQEFLGKALNKLGLGKADNAADTPEAAEPSAGEEGESGDAIAPAPEQMIKGLFGAE